MINIELITHEYLQRAFQLLGNALNDINVAEVKILKKPHENALVYEILTKKDKPSSQKRLRYVKDGNLISQSDLYIPSIDFLNPRPESSVVDVNWKETIEKPINYERKFLEDALGTDVLDCELVKPAPDFTYMIARDENDDVELNPFRREPYIMACDDHGDYVSFQLAMLKEGPDFKKAFGNFGEKMGLIRTFAKRIIKDKKKYRKDLPGQLSEKDLVDDTTSFRVVLAYWHEYEKCKYESDAELNALANLTPDEIAELGDLADDIVEGAADEAKDLTINEDLAQRIGDPETLLAENKDVLFNFAELRYQKRLRGNWMGLEQITHEWNFTKETPSTNQ